MHQIFITTDRRNAIDPRAAGISDKFLQEGKLTARSRSSNPGRKSGSGAGQKAGAPKKAEAQLRLEKREAADCLAGMLRGLREVAGGAEQRFLAYLIEIAMQEAQAEKGRTDSR